MENIKLIVLDVDGTLTDGKIYTNDFNDSMKAFDVRDGFAIYEWIKLGGKVAILTGKKSNIVERRAKELGIPYIIQNSRNKVEDLKKLLEEINLTFNNVAYMGDDINDIGVMKKVHLAACPRNSSEEVLRIVDFISSKNGGNGAVRELLEKIMKEKYIKEYNLLHNKEEYISMWDKIVEKYFKQ